MVLAYTFFKPYISKIYNGFSYIYIYIVWGKDMKRENHRIKPVQGAVHPNYMLGQAQTNLDKVVREIEESGTPEKPEGQVLLRGLEIDHQVHKAES